MSIGISACRRSNTTGGGDANHIWYSDAHHIAAMQAAISMPARISAQANGW